LSGDASTGAARTYGSPGLGAVTADRAGPEGVLGQLRCLQGRPFVVEELAGGLTNHNLKVSTETDALVVRLSRSDTGLLAIDRDDEYHNSVGAAAAGVGAPVVEYRPELGALVVGFVDARTCSRADLTDSSRLERIVAACRRLHGGPRFRNRFDMFRLQSFYLSVTQEHGFRLPERYLEFMPRVDRIKAALAATDEGTVPCHNDLLAENCLDDGARAWLIDYEYSGNNDPCFELGNLWSESDLSRETLDEIITCYYGVFDPQKAARARLQGLMSKYGWMLWAAIRDGAAPLGFDFWTWGLEKYERAVAEFDGPDFETLLDRAAGR
jgi:thiamine kinase-like enzyme